MKRVGLLLVVVLVLCSVQVLAGEYLMNDTEAVARALRVVFSEPVLISTFGDILLTVEPEGKEIEFLFSDGEVVPWEGQWIVWAPSTAGIVEYEWLPEMPTSCDDCWWETDQIWAFTQTLTGEWLQPLTAARQLSIDGALDLYRSLGLDVAGWNCTSWAAGWKPAYANFVETMHENDLRVVGGFSGLAPGWEHYSLHNEDLSSARLVDPFGNNLYDDLGYQQYVVYSVLHPARQRFILSYLQDLVDCGVDAISVDELAYGSVFYPDFNPHTLDLFKEYLETQYSSQELKQLATQFGFGSFADFDYAAAVRQILPSDMDGVTRENWGSVQWEYDIPLRDDYYRFVRTENKRFADWLLSEVKEYALATQGREIPVSANINDFTAPEAFMLVDLLDYVDLEWFYHDRGYPPSARGFPSLRVAQAVGKRGLLLTGMDTRPDLRERGPEGSITLLKTLIADAYAADGVFYVEEGAHDMHFDMDTLAPFWQFVESRPYLFEEIERVSGSIAILQLYESLDAFRSTDYRGLCHLLADCGYQFSTILGSTDELVPYPLRLHELKRYDVILIPQLRGLEEQHADILLAYVRSGGRVVAFAEPNILNWGRSGAARQFFTYLEQGKARVGSGLIVHINHLIGKAYIENATNEVRAGFSTIVASLGLTPEVEYASPRFASAFAYTGGDSVVVHFVNYDYTFDGDTTAVFPSGTATFNIQGLATDALTAVWYTPTADPLILDHVRVGDAVSVTLPELDVWGVLLLTSDVKTEHLASTTLPLASSEKAFAVDWDAVPDCLVFSIEEPTWYNNYGDTDFANAIHWGKDGHRVKGIKAVVTGEHLAVRLELHSGDVFGECRYYCHFRVPGLTLHVRIEPHRQSGNVSYSRGVWKELGSVTRDLFASTDSSAEVLIPFAYFEDVFNPSLLESSTVTFHIDFLAGDRKEGFGFPGECTVHVLDDS